MTERFVNSWSFSYDDLKAIAFWSTMLLSPVPESLPPLRPFLKWAGGKRQLLPELRRFVPPAIAGDHEPFLGKWRSLF
jgi:hypothetical protein